MSPLLHAYLAFSYVSGPIWKVIHHRRLKRGKETPERLPEKYGRYPRERPDGLVLWFHALSVGESLALVPLIERALDDLPEAHVVLTTSTATSAEALSRASLPTRCIHVLLPVDTVRATRAFLSHWRPDIAAFSELDFWPRLMIETHRSGVPMFLINSRLPEKSLASRERLGQAMRDILSLFDRMLVQDAASFERFQALGADKRRISVVGALKSAARPLPADQTELAQLRASIGTRAVWLAAATWSSEHPLVVAAHEQVRRVHRDALLIIAPRHIRDADGAEAEARKVFNHVARRSRDERPDTATAVYLADTIGEMGLWYRLAEVSFIGHSLDPRDEKLEGKNPFEAAALGSVILHGPAVSYFAESYEALTKAGAAREVIDARTLGQAVTETMTRKVSDPMRQGAAKVIASRRGVLENTWHILKQALPQ